MLVILDISLIAAATIVFFSHRILCYLRHFQEGNYCRREFKNWLLVNGIYDKKGSLIATIAAILCELTEERNVMLSLGICAMGAVALIYLTLWENDPLDVGPFKLQPTRQARAIHKLAVCLYSISFSLAIVALYKLGAGDDIACYWLLVIVAIQSSPFWLFLAGSIKFRY
jgi:hypothetical protein